MAKEALIKLRCSPELKQRLESIAAAKEQSLSDFVRTRLIELLPQIEAQAGIIHEPRSSDTNADAMLTEEERKRAAGRARKARRGAISGKDSKPS